MAFNLPALPRTAQLDFGLTDNSGRLTPPTGGPSQTILRSGNKFFVRVSIPALRNDTATARAWLAAQVRHKTTGEPMRLAIPQADAATMPAGAKVDGAGQAGTLLAMKLLGAGKVVPALAFFSFVSGGRSYLHTTYEQATADGTGDAIIGIGPALRVSPADGLALNFPAPVLEGEMDLGPVEWTLERLQWVGVGFTLTEIE